MIDLHKLKNFNGVQEILTGLNATPIVRLSQTWGKLRKKFPKISKDYESIQTDLSLRLTSDKYSEYISSSTPVLPYLGVYLSDLMYLDQTINNTVKLDEEYVNISKMAKISKIISEFKVFKRQPYHFTKVPVIYEFFSKGLIYLDDDRLMEISKEIEDSANIRSGSVSTAKRKTLMFSKDKKKDKDKK